MITLFIWTGISLLFSTTYTQECDKDVRNATFTCQFSISNIQESLQCKSSILFESDSYFTVHLYKTEHNDNSIGSDDFFVRFLNSKFDSNSSFYDCKNVPSFWNDCLKEDACLTQIPQFIEEQFVKSLNLSFAKVPLENFQNFSSLESITIINTALNNLSDVYFHVSNTLQELILTNNSIRNLGKGIFVDFNKLKLIDLSINNLKYFPKEAFGILESLEHLNLSYNSIEFMQSDTFKGFPNLKELYIKNNNLLNIENSTFDFNNNLSILDISNNGLKFLSQKLFSSLTNLKSFSCVQCQLYELDRNIFWNSPNLNRIELNGNDITNLPKDFLHNQPFIEFINLSRNKISDLSPFKNKSRLRTLLISENKLSYLKSDVFLEAPYLFHINISSNNLKIITDDHVQPLKDCGSLDLSNNNITTVELGKKFKLKIRALDISANAVTRFDVLWRNFFFLEWLNMDHNHITYLDLPPCIPNVKQTITFSFQYNKITKVGLYDLLGDEEQAQTDRKMSGCLFNGMPKNFIDLTHNPLVCDCDLYPLYNYIKRRRRIKLNSFLNIQNLTCASPPLLQNELISALPKDVFSCKVTDNCPVSCTCGIRGQDNKTFVNCTNSRLFEVPLTIPLKTTLLYFSKNHLNNMLSLNFKIWKNLTELHLNKNQIHTLEGWDIPSNLNYLSLQGNKIEEIPNSFADFMSSRINFSLFISNNDTKCDCKRKSLKNFLIKNDDAVKDISNITCEIDNNGTKTFLPLYKIPDSILCSDDFTPHNSKLIVIWLCFVFILLITTVLIYYKQRQLILSYLFIHCEQLFQIFCEESEYDEEKVFDGFVAYSSSNRDIVMELLQELEEKEPYFQLCIHERDWLPGRYISDNIIHSVQSSKRTIIVLSDQFITSPWFRLELRAAVFKVSKDKMNKIIVILANSSTSLDGIDTELRHVITKRTYLVWGERWFWEKLRYAMPHKTCEQKPERLTLSDNRRRESELTLVQNDVNNSNAVEV